MEKEQIEQCLQLLYQDRETLQKELMALVGVITRFERELGITGQDRDSLSPKKEEKRPSGYFPGRVIEILTDSNVPLKASDISKLLKKELSTITPPRTAGFIRTAIGWGAVTKTDDKKYALSKMYISKAG